VSLGAHERVSTKIGSVEPGLPAAEAGLKPGDRILAVDAQKVQTFEELRAQLQPRYDRPVSLTVDRNGKEFAAELTPAKAVDTNPIETVPRGMIGISPYAKPPLIGVPAGSPAANAGLKTFDRIVQVNGEPVKDEPAFNAAMAKATGAVELQVARADPLKLPGAAAQIPRLERVSGPKQPGEGYAAVGAESADLYVAAVLAGSPAEQAGIKPGDRLLQLNGKELKSWLIFALAVNELGEKPFTLRWSSGSVEKTAELRQ